MALSGEIERWLQEAIGTRLGTPAEQVDPQVPFVRFGLDSVESVGITGELERWLGLPLSPTLLFDHPSIRALAEHLGGLEGDEEA